MGVVNVTPDSFSDGGRLQDPDEAAESALRLLSEGADLIDIGGESTRPGATPTTADDEVSRVIPVLRRLRAQTDAPLSVDTHKPVVAAAALAAGADVINDIRAGTAGLEMWELLRSTRAGYVCMHMQGVPATMQQAPRYDDVVAEVDSFFRERLKALANAGVSAEQVVLDPGFGFGKTPEHNLQLLRATDRLSRQGRPLLIGVSRKSFLGRLVGGEVTERLGGALACTLWTVRHGVGIVRTHDVAATVQALRMQTLLGEGAA